MPKSIHTFSIEQDVSQHLDEIKNKSELVNQLLRTYFGSTTYTATALEKAEAKMRMLQEQFEKEKEQANKIIIETKRVEEEALQTQKEQQDMIKRKEEEAKSYEIERIRRIQHLREILGFEPSNTQIVGYLTMIKTDEYEKANEFILKWKKEHEQKMQSM